MSQENVEVISSMYRAWNGGDMDALVAVFDADVEVRPALSTFLQSSVYRGHEGVLAWYAETYQAAAVRLDWWCASSCASHSLAPAVPCPSPAGPADRLLA